tara:strand:+ start:910 stop:1449 length:540 start_codon:yes stop_codon:yes gene_type:complete
MNFNFHQALDMVLEHEGGYVDHPDDPGGKTFKGITGNTYTQWLKRKHPFEEVEITEEFMKSIPSDHIEAIYLENYWNKCKCDHLPSGLDVCVFDWSVNSGPGRAAKALQRAVGADPDGAIGPMTLEKVAQCNVLETIEKITEEREAFYRSLKTFDTFGKGWLRRNEETGEAAKLLEMKQ